MKRFIPKVGVFRSRKNIALLVIVLCTLGSGSVVAFHQVGSPSDGAQQKPQSNQSQQGKTNETKSGDEHAEVKSAQTSQPSQAATQTATNAASAQTNVSPKSTSPKPAATQPAPVAKPPTPPASIPPIITSVTIALTGTFLTHPDMCGVSGSGYSYTIHFGGGSNIPGTIAASWDYQITSGQQITPRLPRTFSAIALTPTTYRVTDTPPIEAVGVIEQSFYASYRVRLYVTGTNPTYSNWIDVPQARSCS